MLAGRLPAVGGVTVLVTFVLLLAFTRSVLIPVKALVLNALSRIVDEHRRGSDTETAVAVGLQRTGGLFTSAALVFATVMAALALAVLLDCTVIRALLVPAVMRLAGRANWWMPRLGRRKDRSVPSPTPVPAAPMEAP